MLIWKSYKIKMIFKKKGRKDSPISMPPRSSTVNVLVYFPEEQRK